MELRIALGCSSKAERMPKGGRDSDEDSRVATPSSGRPGDGERTVWLECGGQDSLQRIFLLACPARRLGLLLSSWGLEVWGLREEVLYHLRVSGRWFSETSWYQIPPLYRFNPWESYWALFLDLI